MTPAGTQSPNVFDVGQADFQEAVLERSAELPVVVDFWAEWCGPCRVLGPILESEIDALAGRVMLAKVNTESDPELATHFNVQGIPAVKAFRNGQVVAEFVGARPATAVREWLASLLPSEGEETLARALAAAESGSATDAEALLQPLLADAAFRDRAALALASVLVSSGRPDEAKQALEGLDTEGEIGAGVRSLLRQIAFFADAAAYGGESAAHAALARDPKSLDARYALASAQAARGDVAAALENFLEIVTRNRKFKDDGARLAMLALFDQLGRDSDLARDYRRRLQVVL
jgi:putative thioredoxin